MSRWTLQQQPDPWIRGGIDWSITASGAPAEMMTLPDGRVIPRLSPEATAFRFARDMAERSRRALRARVHQEMTASGAQRPAAMRSKAKATPTARKRSRARTAPVKPPEPKLGISLWTKQGWVNGTLQ
jgi:hypothetical protein